MTVSIDKIRRKVDLFQCQSYSAYLKAVYQEIKKLTKPFTLTDYSNALGFGHNNTMAQIHSGHRRLSVKGAGRIAQTFKLSRYEKHYFQTLVNISEAKNQREKEKWLELLLDLRGRYGTNHQGSEELQFFNRWHHAVVFELLDAKIAKTPQDLQKSFTMSISHEEVCESLELLTRLGLAKQVKSKGDSYLKAKENFSSGTRVPGMAIVRYHQEMMNLAKASLDETPPNQRDISSVTIAIDEQLITRLKDDIAMFRQYLLFLAAQSKEAKKIMQVNIQLFPLNK